MKTQKIVKGIMVGMVILVVAFYLAYQVFQSYYAPVKTETAHLYTVYDKVDTEIFAVRREGYVTQSQQGVVVHAVGNGEKVAKGGAVAYVFETQQDAQQFLRYDEIDKEIGYLNSLQLMAAGVFTLDPDMLGKKINHSLYDMLDVMASGKLEQLRETSETFVDYMNRRLVFTGSLQGLEERIQSLREEQAELPAKGSLPHTVLRADSSGYFSGITDGFEGSVDAEAVLSMTPEEVDALFTLTPAPLPTDAIGKLVYDFKWYLICNAPAKYTGTLKIGDQITVVLPLSDNSEIPAVIRGMNKLGERSSLILECSRMDDEVASLRRETAQIRLKRYDGLRISSKAIRVEEGETGVYVLVGNVVKFRNINVLYKGTDFVVVEQVDTSQWGNYDYLHLYDEVILSGKKLFDGKVME